jgi:hypothetical protein
VPGAMSSDDVNEFIATPLVVSLSRHPNRLGRGMANSPKARVAPGPLIFAAGAAKYAPTSIRTQRHERH